MIDKLRLGCLHFGSSVDYKNAKKIINYSIENGINEFDSAPLYGNKKSLDILAKSLRNNTHDLTISISFGLVSQLNKLNKFGVKTERFQSVDVVRVLNNFEKEANRSFKFIVNIHALHQHQNINSLYKEMYAVTEIFNDISFSISNISPSYYNKIKNSKHFPNLSFSTLQVQASIFEQRLLEEASKIDDIYIVANRPFSRGLLAQDYSQNNIRPIGSRSISSSRLDFYLKSPYFDALIEIVDFIKDFGVDKKMFCLYWLTNKKNLKKIVFGVRTPEQLSFLKNFSECDSSKFKTYINTFDLWLETRPDLNNIVKKLPRFTFER